MQAHCPISSVNMREQSKGNLEQMKILKKLVCAWTVMVSPAPTDHGWLCMCGGVIAGEIGCDWCPSKGTTVWFVNLSSGWWRRTIGADSKPLFSTAARFICSSPKLYFLWLTEKLSSFMQTMSNTTQIIEQCIAKEVGAIQFYPQTQLGTHQPSSPTLNLATMGTPLRITTLRPPIFIP